jgi:hypothetical protein
VIGTVEKSDSLVALSMLKYLKRRSETKRDFAVFPCPTASEMPSMGQYHYPLPHLLEFKKGERWLVFLNESPNGNFALVDAATNIDDGEKAVRYVLTFDSIKHEDVRCRILVKLVFTSNVIFHNLALHELNFYNKPQYLKILAPLGNTNELLLFYIGLLKDNSNTDATGILLSLLDSKKERYLVDIIRAISVKDNKNDSISEKILSFISHPCKDIRQTVILALNWRNYYKAFPHIGNCLDDVDKFVRLRALDWPWYVYDFKANPATLEKIRMLADDRDEIIREAASKALIGARQTQYFYFLWRKSIFDESQFVRRSINLSLLFEHNPTLILFFIFWPTIFLFVVLLSILKRRSSTRIFKILALTILLGYLCGASAGWLIGKFHSDNPYFNAIILGPGIVLPIFLLACLFWALKKKPEPVNKRLSR